MDGYNLPKILTLHNIYEREPKGILKCIFMRDGLSVCQQKVVFAPKLLFSTEELAVCFPGIFINFVFVKNTVSLLLVDS